MTDDEYKRLGRLLTHADMSETDVTRVVRSLVSRMATELREATSRPLIEGGMTAIDDRATALILRDQVNHLEDALREAGNLARGLEQQVRESKTETGRLQVALYSCGFRAAPDQFGLLTLWCLECHRNRGLHWKGCGMREYQ